MLHYVHDDDTDCQRILWRYNLTEPIDCYKLLRLTFGTSCAPYLAVRCLQQLAIEEETRYPAAARITLKDFYMDDLLSGAETETDCIEIYEQLVKLMKAGGFTLQKWCTNSQKLLNHCKSIRQSSDQTLIFKENNMVKVLGICWNKNNDSFEYMYKLPDTVMPVTKRKVLSEISRLYDPLGWIAPVIITAKIFMQKLWKSGLCWDDNITSNLIKDWTEFKADLVNVKDITIPRWLQVTKNDNIELHAFADASQAAYAAAVYVKVKDTTGCVNVNLVSARTRVTPVEKEVSIPRLELCAALLASQLIAEILHILSIPKDNIYGWTDSTVTLAWLRGEPSRWTTFVSNRVSEILRLMERDHWNHVKTMHNPVDCASRGITARELIDHNLWWHGPEWLKRTDDYSSMDLREFVTNEEQRHIKVMNVGVQLEEDFIWTRYSNLTKMLRILSLCKRVAQWKKPKKDREYQEIITPKEIEQILSFCIRDTQELYFKEEIKLLTVNKNLPKSSKLHSLCPFMDENKIMRVGGRIDLSQECFAKKHPVILPGNSHLTKLIILDAHSKTFHGGPLAMLNYVRSRYWILRARNHIKKIYRSCVTCLRYSRQATNQFMGQLPSVRIKPERAFKSTGVDFTGFIKVRHAPGRGSRCYKAYICVFICMVTRAIHLEAVSDLTSDAFIAAFRRFVSRRGHCKDLFSDNATNFVGADKELRNMFSRAVSDLPKEISSLLANEGTTWHFIPPQAPNFGGLWEAGVRSVKAHLKRVIGESTLTYEELSTLLAQIEACLNSRPLCQLSDNPEDPLPLTPAHFLVGEPIITLPDQDYSNINVSAIQRWKYLQKMVSDFWRRWSTEYLTSLNQRFKWSNKRKEPEIGDVVIMQDHNIPPAKWMLATIIDKHPGKDNITRVVTIKTKNGLMKRALNKLYFLPKPEDDS